MKKLLFLFITSLVPLVASLPPENFKLNNIKTVEAMYKRGYTVNSYLENLYNKKNLSALVKLGVSSEGIKLFFATGQMMQDHNNSAKTMDPKIHCNADVPAFIVDAFEENLQSQDFHLPVLLCMTNDGGTLAKFPHEIVQNFQDFNALNTQIGQNIRDDEPIASLTISNNYDPKTIKFEIAHEIGHLKGDAIKTGIVIGNLWQKVTSNPNYQRLSKTEQEEVRTAFDKKLYQNPTFQEILQKREEFADINAEMLDQSLIEPARYHFNKKLKQFPENANTNYGTHPTYTKRSKIALTIKEIKEAEETYISLLSQSAQPQVHRATFGNNIIAAQNFVNNNNNNNNFKFPGAPASKRQRKF